MTILKVKEYVDFNQQSLRQLSKSTGLSRTTIRKMVDSENAGSLRLSSLISVANHFGCKVEDLIHEKSYGKEGENYEIC